MLLILAKVALQRVHLRNLRWVGALMVDVYQTLDSSFVHVKSHWVFIRTTRGLIEYLHHDQNKRASIWLRLPAFVVCAFLQRRNLPNESTTSTIS